MDKIVIRGGARLRGEVSVSGAKNAALPILASSILSGGTSLFKNVPALNDLRTMGKLLSLLGAAVEHDVAGHTMRIAADGIRDFNAPYELVKTMRASVLVLGPLVARHGQASVSLPGGCAIGARPIDQHLKGLEAMGAKITLEHGNVIAKAKRLRGASIAMSAPIAVSPLMCRSTGRSPMAQPPGSDTRASPKRAVSGPSARMEARIVFTSS